MDQPSGLRIHQSHSNLDPPQPKLWRILLDVELRVRPTNCHRSKSSKYRVEAHRQISITL
jgi:hypothetical protein